MTATWQEILERPGNDSLHIAQVYQDDAFLLEGVGRFVRTGLREGEGVVLIMRASRREAAMAQLQREGVDLAEAEERGQVAVHDADELLKAVTKNGTPDRHAFHRVVGDAIRGMRRRYRVVRAFGEMVDMLWREGRGDDATRLEAYWRELSRIEPFALLCAYHLDMLNAEKYGDAFDSMCHTHTHIIPARDYRRLDEAVSRASHDVLDVTTVMMLETVAERDRPLAEMPRGQVILLWLSRNMPRTAEKVLARVRALYNAAA